MNACKIQGHRARDSDVCGCLIMSVKLEVRRFDIGPQRGDSLLLLDQRAMAV